MVGLRKFTGLFILLSFLTAKYISVFSCDTMHAATTCKNTASTQFKGSIRLVVDQDSDREVSQDINPDKGLGTDHDGGRGSDPDSEGLPDEEKESKNTELPEDVFITEPQAGLIQHSDAKVTFTPYITSYISSYYAAPYQPPEA